MSKKELKQKALGESKAKEELDRVKREVGKSIVGQLATVESVLRGLLCDGHVLLEGVPGIAKTLLLNTVSTAISCESKRIQFTPDLLPSDLMGLTTYNKDRGFEVVKGPIFSNFVLADEINRAPPKVQSALLEAMQEKQVTIGKGTFPLDRPFLVMATQNPIDSLGTYPLPQAQVDRFLFKVKLGYPPIADEKVILDQNATTRHFSDFNIGKVITKERILELQKEAKGMFCSDEVKSYIVRIIESTRAPNKFGIRSGKYIEYGASPRASIGLYSASKAEALMQGLKYVTPQCVKTVAYDVLRHRLMLNYEGQAEGFTSEKVIDEILSKVPIK